MNVEVKVPVNASVSQLWDTLSAIQMWPQWTSTIKRVQRLDEGPLHVGCRTRIRQSGQGSLVWTVTELVPGSSFQWRARRPGFSIVASHLIESDRSGAVTLVLHLQLDGPLFRVLGPFARSRAQRFLVIEAEGHRQHAEALRD